METSKKNETYNDLEIKEMARGGVLVYDDSFLLEIGAYPETIKDTLKTSRGVPDLYLVPEEMFDITQGISAADIEFPAYYNYFTCGRKLRFICRKHQVRPLLRILKESMFGPTRLDITGEFVNGENTPGFPNLRREMAMFKENPRPGVYLNLKHIVEPIIFDENRKVTVDGVTITDLGGDCYRFEKQGIEREVQYEPLRMLPQNLYDSGEFSGDGFYVPPIFGITVIGSGHGFDAGAKTSGFIIWIGGKGILIDPPVNSTAWLRKNRINTRLIEDLILTHCHADHDSGTLQKILEEGIIRVHTTETIMNSFVTKYRTLTGLTRSEFSSLFSFEPVYIGQPVSIVGGAFRFRYTLHSIPTIGFTVEFQGKSFTYSSDTLYAPDTLRHLNKNGVLSKGRMDDLLNFPWESTVVFHEAGVPPIHTPISAIIDLPDNVKQRLYLIHVSEDTVPAGSGLKIAPSGPSDTITLDVTEPGTSLAHRMLDVMAHIDLFRDMKVEKALEFLALTRCNVREPGEIIIKKGTRGDQFYMILSGEVEVKAPHLPNRLIYSQYDYIGETSIILNQPRNADVVAKTRVELLSMEQHDFLHFIRGTNLHEDFTRLAINRERGARWLFEEHPVLSKLSPYQKNQLMRTMRGKEIEKGTYLYRIGEPLTSYYWINQGKVTLWKGTKKIHLGKGDLLGEFDRYLQSAYYSGTVQAETALEVYRIPADDMKIFFKSNPGIYLRFLRWISTSPPVKQEHQE